MSESDAQEIIRLLQIISVWLGCLTGLATVWALFDIFRTK